MKGTKKRFLAGFLALIMCICILPAAAETPDNLYVYIGDSMSFNFTERHNYYYSTYIYPQQTADALGLTLTDAGTLPGGRFTDAYAMMSDYNGDAYTWDELSGYIGSADRRANYTQSIMDASVITTQMGYSGASMYLLKNIMSIVGGDGPLYSADLNQIFTPEELSKAAPFASKCMKLMLTAIGEDTLAALKQFVNCLSDKQKEAINGLLGEEAVATLSGSTETIKQITDSLIYTFVAQMVHFDRTVERIYELNPDVELYVMGLTNPMQHLSLSFSVGKQDFVIDIGDLLGKTFDFFNLYMKVLSPNSDRYYFVDNLESVENYGQAMANDLNVAQGILYTYYNDESFTGHDVPGTPAYEKSVAMAPGVSYALKNTSCIDLGKLVGELVNGMPDIGDQEACFEKLIELDENGVPTASYLEQCMAHVYMFTMMIGVYVHPTQNAHDAEAPLLIKAMQEKKVAPEAIIYHKLNAPIEQVLKALDNSTCIDSFIDWVNDINDIWSKPSAEASQDVGSDTDEPEEVTPDTPQPAPKPTVTKTFTTTAINIVKSINVTVKSVVSRLTSFFR